jgi:redox-sensitive bicupin YhaK (pirin superfamily)
VQRLVQRIVLAPDDGSLGPLLRVADDRLPPGDGYGQHEHRAVDVVAVVLAGSLRHRWDGDVPLSAGDVAVLRAGTGLEHDEVAGPDGARVLQCYLRSTQPARPATHEVHRAASGWVDLGRADARLWLGPAGDQAPSGLRLAVTADGVRVTDAPPAGSRLLVWALDPVRPDWATD